MTDAIVAYLSINNVSFFIINRRLSAIEVYQWIKVDRKLFYQRRSWRTNLKDSWTKRTHWQSEVNLQLIKEKRTYQRSKVTKGESLFSWWASLTFEFFTIGDTNDRERDFLSTSIDITLLKIWHKMSQI